MRVQLEGGRLHGLPGHAPHPGEQIPIKVASPVTAAINILLEIAKRQFVARLMPAIVLAPLLDCVVGQVHEVVRQVMEGVLFRAGAQIALAVPVAPQHPVYA